MAKRNFFSRTTIFGFPLNHPITIIFLLTAFFHIIQYFTSNSLEGGSDILVGIFGLRPIAVIELSAYWQVFTYGLLHSTGGLPFHFIMNMYVLYLTGKFLIPVIGNKHFTFVYLISLIGSGIFIVIMSYGTYYLSGQEKILYIYTIGASGAIFGLLAIFGIIYPDLVLYLFYFIPIRSQYLVIVSVVMGVALTYFFKIPISNTGHIGGAICGYLYFYFFIRKSSKLSFLENFKAVSKEPKNSIEKMMDSQTSTNQKILKNLEGLSKEDKERFLVPMQVENANICPPNVFNTEDPFCLRCEWLVNCSLRKLKTEEKDLE